MDIKATPEVGTGVREVDFVKDHSAEFDFRGIEARQAPCLRYEVGVLITARCGE